MIKFFSLNLYLRKRIEKSN